MNYLFVVGTRPEVIKVAPVYKRFKETFDDVFLLATAQHREMMDMMLEVFDIEPDIDMDLMEEGQTLNSFSSKVLSRIDKVLDKMKPDVVFVQGDTTTAFMVALASFHKGIAVAHIEAGLRSHDLKDPFPEEMNRKLIDNLSEYLFAPTKTSFENLVREGISKSRIHLVGNTVVDALEIIRGKYDLSEVREGVLGNNFEYVLVTLHRRESWGEPMKRILKAIKRFMEETKIRIVFPVHRNPKVRRVVHDILGETQAVLLEPVDYVTFLSLIEGSKFILTDSGGVQEEAPSFGKFVVVARDRTERPELIDNGLGILAGKEEEGVYRGMIDALDRKIARSVNPFGDGRASERIRDLFKKGAFEPFMVQYII